MVKWFKSLFAWKKVKVSGVYTYWENTVSMERGISRNYPSGYSPIDTDWLEHKEPKPLIPPTGGSGFG